MSALSEALEHLRRGGMIVLVDDEDRENEGDIVVAAEFATADAVNFMARHGRGLICLSMAADMIDKFGLPPMTHNNGARRSTAFTISIEAREGISTGISAADRARTIATAIDPKAQPGDIVSPGHIFPLRAAEGGVLKRTGHTEGAVDLMRLAGLRPAGVICEIMRDDGEMARRPDLEIFAKTHGLPILTIEQIVRHRKRSEINVREVAQADLPSSFTDEPLRIHAFHEVIGEGEHLALVKHPLPEVPLVRVHSECLTGEALGSLRCDCGPQLQKALQLISESEGGVLVYLRNQEGRGIGLANKIKAYALQDRGHDTIDANTALGFGVDERDYSAAAGILRSLGVNRLRLLSNNPDKTRALADLGLDVVEQVPLVIASNPFNASYLATKRDRLGHFIPQ
ncbi:MAG: 3,4-dihydroxy-2-butanone-4-phosphate synthase [Proteobacteria bacterium]|nr:3,4-dihydroxy-2-butanone-4-phosphate synthase [Pseudomonadota bacterium]